MYLFCTVCLYINIYIFLRIFPLPFTCADLTPARPRGCASPQLWPRGCASPQLWPCAAPHRTPQLWPCAAPHPSAARGLRLTPALSLPRTAPPALSLRRASPPALPLRRASPQRGPGAAPHRTPGSAPARPPRAYNHPPRGQGRAWRHSGRRAVSRLLGHFRN